MASAARFRNKSFDSSVRPEECLLIFLARDVSSDFSSQHGFADVGSRSQHGSDLLVELL
jgi:hypothetical protein